MCRNITDSKKEYRKRPIVYETPNKMHKKRENCVKTGAKNWKKKPLTRPINSELTSLRSMNWKGSSRNNSSSLMQNSIIPRE